MTGIIRRQAIRWCNQEEKGEMPEALYEAFTKVSFQVWEENHHQSRQDFNNHFKRPITHNRNPSVWRVFKRLGILSFGLSLHIDNCELCNAALRRIVFWKTRKPRWAILIGNVCVNRYIEIRDTSHAVLSGEEKKEYLKTQMTEAKRSFSAKTSLTIPDRTTRFEAVGTIHGWKEVESLSTASFNRCEAIGDSRLSWTKDDERMGEVSRNGQQEYEAWLHREEQRKLTQRARIEYTKANELISLWS